MTERLSVGLVTADGGGSIGLADAARRHPGLSIRSLDADEPASDAVAALIVDAPIARRGDILARAARSWQVPILVESPVASDLERADSLRTQGTQVVSANPLRYALHTRALVDALARDADPLETFFAAWRFRANAMPEHALPQLADFIAALRPHGEVERITALERQDPGVLLVTLRYAIGTLGTLELGTHLPSTFPSASELFIECFSTERAYHCTPENQSVLALTQSHAAHNWQPNPADTIVAAFTAWLVDGPRPVGNVASDLAALELTARIRAAAHPNPVDGQPAQAR